ncbi:TetR family transcriptional regulator [Brachybacterium sp. JHP9]|uniref:TetR family transcriptional regulator n=1 Tax=Brachybacterium equifaecis TaxID=2910770 RepID=A0ABT0R5V7_9MICO|nr:TetR family transcriptional regulator [Brachybacterium equifaecis]MCL6424300.1 TetR family transcriptional regulator [Brachybacterium equifaecis]
MAARPRRHDPERRDRIIDACLDVIAEHGVAGTSHRRVAAAADVPLGSMTYHFEGMDALLHEAFSRFADDTAAKVERRMERVTDREGALEAFTANIEQDVLTTDRDLVLTLELYTLAARRPAFRDLTSRWMTRTRATLEPFVDPRTAQLLDAMNEGLTIHRALHVEPVAPGLAQDAVERLAGERGD